MNAVEQVKYYLSQANCLPDVVLLKQNTTSTNENLLELLQQFPDLDSALICSEQQTQGRGQHKRSWQSPLGNIYFSCLARFKTPINGRFALEVALNILDTPTLKPFSLQIKWANDLYSALGKWGGILIEPVDTHTAIVGIGINLHPIPSEQKQHILQDCTSLSELNIPFAHNQLISELYIAVQQAIQWFDYGSYNLTQRFNHQAYLFEQDIQFEHHGQIFTGQYVGIQHDGALCLKQGSHIQSFYQGRIILSS